jgi:hypothetical protein
VAYFYSKSHFLPVTPLSFSETISWMQRSRFCLCPPGDVPYNKRYFTALLSGCARNARPTLRYEPAARDDVMTREDA